MGFQPGALVRSALILMKASSVGAGLPRRRWRWPGIPGTQTAQSMHSSGLMTSMFRAFDEAVDGTHVHTIGVFALDAVFGNDVGHGSVFWESGNTLILRGVAGQRAAACQSNGKRDQGQGRRASGPFSGPLTSTAPAVAWLAVSTRISEPSTRAWPNGAAGRVPAAADRRGRWRWVRAGWRLPRPGC